MKPLISIVGPTASGKTDLSLYLAKKHKGEIICADSRTIYRGLDIGTAKPYLNFQFSIFPPSPKATADPPKLLAEGDNSQSGPVYEIGGIIHYMLDIVKPNETFTVAQFQEMAYKIIEDILKRNKIPFLVGGTGLYIDAVTKGLLIPTVPPNSELREKLEKMSNKTLFAKLKKLDPKSASKIDPSNKRRFIRALEVCLISDRPFSEQQKIKKPPYRVLTLGIKIPREKLYPKIDERVDKMVKMGLVDEVKKLLKKGYSLDLPSMSGLGYKQITDWLLYQNPKTQEETIELIKRDTRHFARRQISWFKRDKNIKWLGNKNEAERLIKKFLKGRI